MQEESATDKFTKRIYKDYLKESMLKIPALKKTTPKVQKSHHRMLKFKINQKAKLHGGASGKLYHKEGTMKAAGMNNLDGKVEPLLPYKTLEAPGLEEDYYMNLLDWSSQGLVGIYLSSAVYVWDNEKKLISDVFRAENEFEAICSVKFSVDGN